MQRSMTSLIIGIICAVVAVALMYFYVQSSLRNAGVVQQAPAIQMGTVVVASKEIRFGAPIDRLTLKMSQWPKASIPQDAFATVDEIFADAKQPGDRVALALIHPDEPVTRPKISGFGEKPTLSRQVSNEMRAVSVRVDDVLGVSGFVLPGDRVDIMLTRRIGNGQDNLVTDIILQNITVLGIDQTADQGADKPIVARTATVEVTPEDAQKLALAQQAGTLGLILRSYENGNSIATRQITERDLATTRPAPVRPPEAPPAPPSVRIRYGDGTTVDKPVRP